MKAIIGAAIGVFAIGLVLIGAGRLSIGARGVSASTVPALTSFSSAPGVPVAGVTAVSPQPATEGASGAVMIDCSPGQRAVVRPASVNGETVSRVACVDDAFEPATAAGGVRAVPVAQRVSYRAPRQAASLERRVVYQEPALRPGSGQAPARVAPERTWKKRLLVIGGSTAAGAGIGGLVGGKKGALIGAALGGGASTLFEATRK